MTHVKGREDMDVSEVSGDQYRNLFLTYHNNPSLRVDPIIWEQTVSRLPDNYFIPDYRIINMIMNME